MTDPHSGAPEERSDGYSMARKALEEARTAARNAGKSVGQGRRAPNRKKGVRGLRSRRGWTGAGEDPFDPQPLGRVAGQLARKRGWNGKISEGQLFGMWASIVGPEVADHAEPVALVETTLHVRAESTAWATQLRLMQAQILAKIAAAVGNKVVTSLRITGPQAPSWRKGPRHVSGRGPRDTYG